jgi:hypothetical protein
MAEKAEKVKLVPKSYRLPIADVEFIQALQKGHVFGSTESDVVRNLIAFAKKDLTENEYVRKYQESMKLLKGEK